MSGQTHSNSNTDEHFLITMSGQTHSNSNTDEHFLITMSGQTVIVTQMNTF